jgi:hypothetical protein
LLNREWFRSRAEAKVLIEQWDSSTTSDGRIAPIATNLRPRFVEPGWSPIISTCDSLLNWLQDAAASQGDRLRSTRRGQRTCAGSGICSNVFNGLPASYETPDARDLTLGITSSSIAVRIRRLSDFFKLHSEN